MDWLNGISISGLPWWAVLLLLLLTFLATKGIDGYLKFWKSRMEEREYADTKTRRNQSALEKELRSQVEELKAAFKTVLEELHETRNEHVNCKIEQEKLRGQIGILEEKVARLEGHDKRDEQHLQGLKEVIKQIDPIAATKIP